MSLIEKLTPEQEALIPVYRQKWQKTERINYHKASEAVKAAYAFIGCEEPRIVFCDSPYAAICLVNDIEQLRNFDVIHCIYYEIEEPLLYAINKQLGLSLSNSLFNLFNLWELNDIEYEISYQIERKNLSNTILYFQDGSARLGILPRHYGLFEFFISIVKCNCDQEKWTILQNLCKYCDRVFIGEKICIICDRPLHLHFDNQNRLHAEGEPAIEYADGFGLYSYHGVTLPEKYGKIHPQQWQSQWLLSEKNAELRRVLIQGIGYARICQELQAIELDTWAEYTLLKIDADVDE